MGVAGKGGDVFDHARNQWQSLVQVSAAQLLLGDLDIGAYTGELSVEVLPANPNGRMGGEFWLPSYFTAWAGFSLAVADPNPFALAGALATMGARVYEPVGADNVPLRYGTTYRFRVRLMDMTGGGPGPELAPLYPSAHGEASVPFRRYVPPKAVRVAAEPARPIAGAAHFEIARPELAYP